MKRRGFLRGLVGLALAPLAPAIAIAKYSFRPIIASDLIGIQPLSAPSGKIFYLKLINKIKDEQNGKA